MKKLWRFLNLIFIMAALFTCLMLHASAAEVVDSGYCGGEGDGTNLSWTLDSEGTLTISGKGKMVRSNVLSDDTPWYSHAKSIKNAVIGDEVTNIGESAFNDCVNLTHITIGSSVKTVDNFAFSGCYSLAELELPASVTSFSVYATNQCYALKTILVSEENQNYCAEDGVLFSKNKTSLVKYPAGKTGASYAIPEGVTTICDYAFYNCEDLTSVTIPNGVVSIGNSAFSYCRKLTSVTIPDSVTSVGQYVFERCENLTSVSIGAGLKSLSEYMFAGCDKLGDVRIPAGVTAIRRNAFRNIKGLIVYFEGNAPSVGDNAFDVGTATLYYASEASGWTDNEAYDAVAGTWNGYKVKAWDKDGDILIYGYCGGEGDGTNLTWELTKDYTLRITGSGDMKSFDHSSIYSTNMAPWYGKRDEIQKVIIDDGVTGISSDAFENCSVLTEVIIPDSVDYIGSDAFMYCKKLTSVNLPEGLTHLSGDMFYDCVSLTSVDIPDSVTSMGWGVFHGCSGLTEVTLPDGLENISVAAFTDCSITSIVIPDSVTDMGMNAFYGCSKLTSVTIGDGLTEISASSFDGCVSLTEVTIPDGVEIICESAFADCYQLTTVDLPEMLKTIEKEAFLNCWNLSALTIGSSVTNIGQMAFSNCSELKRVYFEGNAPEVAADAFASDTVFYYSTKTTGWTDSEAYDEEAGTWNGYTLEMWEERSPLGYGYCGGEGDGTNLTWELSRDGTLTISGSGAMANYTTNYTAQSGGPWNQYNSSVRKVIIGNEVTTVGENAFWWSNNLDSVAIGDGVKTIGKGAFYWCPSLNDVKFGKSVETIGEEAFAVTSNLTSVVIPKSVETIGAYAFRNTSEVYFKGKAPAVTGAVTRGTIYYVPGMSGWTDCEAYDAVAGTWNGQKLEPWEQGEVVASGYCGGEGDGTNLTWVWDSRDVLTITGTGAMKDYNGEDMPWIDFRGDIGAIILGDEVTTVGVYSFVMCDDLVHVELGDSLSVLGDYAFTSCTALTALELPNSLTYIGVYAFGNTSLVSLDIPDHVTEIADWAFYICNGLRSVTIGENVTKIGGVAFYYCTNLTDVYFKGDAPVLDVSPFDETQATLYYIPGTKGWTDSEHYDAKAGTWNGYKLAMWLDALQQGKLAAMEVSMADELLLWLKFELPDELLADDGAYAVVTADKKGGIKKTVIPMSEIRAAGTDKNGRYVIEQGMAAPEMGRDVTVSFVDGQGHYVCLTDYSTDAADISVTRTIVDYALLAMERGSANQKNLNKALLTYGGYAQMYFDVDTAAPVYNVLVDNGFGIPAIREITADSISQEMTATGADLVTPTTQQAFMDSAIYHRVYFTLNSGISVDDLSFELTKRNKAGEYTETVEAVYESAKKRYYIQIDDIASPLLDYMYDIEITDTDGNVQNVQTSVAAYLKLGITKSTNAKQINMFKALYHYNQIANTFFGF